MASRNEEVVRRSFEVLNRSESVDAVMAELEDLMHTELEWVNPEDAIEGGTRKGLTGMRTPSRTSIREREAGRGGSSRRCGSAVSASSFAHASVSRELPAVRRPSGHPSVRSSPSETERLIRMGWHFNPDEAFAEFERGG
jgi:hypothetical protein